MEILYSVGLIAAVALARMAVVILILTLLAVTLWVIASGAYKLRELSRRVGAVVLLAACRAKPGRAGALNPRV
jgi:hypothetical protein